MEKKEEKKKKGIRVANRQAWVDTFVYLCLVYRRRTHALTFECNG